jgi:hypothetical protein
MHIPLFINNLTHVLRVKQLFDSRKGAWGRQAETGRVMESPSAVQQIRVRLYWCAKMPIPAGISGTCYQAVGRGRYLGRSKLKQLIWSERRTT